MLKQDLTIHYSLPKRKNNKVIELMKDNFGGKIMKEKSYKSKTYSYLKDNNDEDKKKTQKSVS